MITIEGVKYYNASQAAIFLGIARITFYRNWVWTKLIAGIRPSGKRTLYYSELDLVYQA